MDRSGCSTRALCQHVRYAPVFDSSVCWGMLGALTASGMLEEAAAFLQVRASAAVMVRDACLTKARLDASLARVILQNRPVHLPLLVSVVGLSLRPVFLDMPRTAEVDQVRVRFCTSVACVPKLVESVPSAMASMFRRRRLWATLVPVLATATSASGLPVDEYVLSHLLQIPCFLATLQRLISIYVGMSGLLVRASVPALLGNLTDLASPLLDGESLANRKAQHCCCTCH